MRVLLTEVPNFGCGRDIYIWDPPECAPRDPARELPRFCQVSTPHGWTTDDFKKRSVASIRSKKGDRSRKSEDGQEHWDKKNESRRLIRPDWFPYNLRFLVRGMRLGSASPPEARVSTCDLTTPSIGTITMPARHLRV